MTNRFVFHSDRLEDMREQMDENVDFYLDDPEFHFDSGDEGYTVEELLMAATERGVVECPNGATLWFEHNAGRDGDPWHRFLVTLQVPVSGFLTLAGPSDDYPTFVRYGTKGRDAISKMLEVAVAEGNLLLDRLDDIRAV